MHGDPESVYCAALQVITAGCFMGSQKYLFAFLLFLLLFFNCSVDILGAGVYVAAVHFLLEHLHALLHAVSDLQYL